MRMRLALAAAGLAMMSAAALAAAVAPVGTAAPTPVSGGPQLDPSHPVLTFKGVISGVLPSQIPSAHDPLPIVCGPDCQQWSVKVASLSPFLVSVRNDLKSTNDGLDLWVYDPSGTQVGSAVGIGADGQAVTVMPTRTGMYTIAVTMTYAFDPNPSYKGEVRLQAGASWKTLPCKGPKACPLLPELRALAPTELHITGLPPVASTPLGFPLPVDLPTNSSCYLDETARTGATRCLRFTSEVDNVGFGILQVQLPWATVSQGVPQSAFIPQECEAQQVIHWTDGSVTRHDAGPCTFHPQHAHFHYNAFVAFGLYAVNANGTRGALAAKSLKESFCLADDGYFGYGTRGPNGPRTYAGQPGCNLPSLPTPDAKITMGSSPGWGDIYTWDTPDQFIDITHVPPGIYDLQAKANPAHRLLESSTSHSCAATRIKLTETSAVVLRPYVPCS